MPPRHSCPICRPADRDSRAHSRRGPSTGRDPSSIGSSPYPTFPIPAYPRLRRRAPGFWRESGPGSPTEIASANRPEIIDGISSVIAAQQGPQAGRHLPPFIRVDSIELCEGRTQRRRTLGGHGAADPVDMAGEATKFGASPERCLDCRPPRPHVARRVTGLMTLPGA